MTAKKEIIKETIVCEGRDDTAALKRAVICETIETHGFGLSEAMWRELDRAWKANGLILLTDPDHAGELIRKKILERYPDAKEAFLPRRQATAKSGNVGVENASPEAIREALAKARPGKPEGQKEAPAAEAGEGKAAGAEGKPGFFTMKDMQEAGLTGTAGSRARREKLADFLGIGYGNAARLLAKLNHYGISRKEFEEALREEGSREE